MSDNPVTQEILAYLRAQLAQRDTEIERLQEALRYYADTKRWGKVSTGGITGECIAQPSTARAQQALTPTTGTVQQGEEVEP